MKKIDVSFLEAIFYHGIAAGYSVRHLLQSNTILSLFFFRAGGRSR